MKDKEVYMIENLTTKELCYDEEELLIVLPTEELAKTVLKESGLSEEELSTLRIVKFIKTGEGYARATE